MQDIDCPFRTGSEILMELREKTRVRDRRHPRGGDRRRSWRWDGIWRARRSAVLGTHTHVQTADERILEGHTAYITDVGMTGPYDSVIGIRKELSISAVRDAGPAALRGGVGSRDTERRRDGHRRRDGCGPEHQSASSGTSTSSAAAQADGRGGISRREAPRHYRGGKAWRPASSRGSRSPPGSGRTSRARGGASRRRRRWPSSSSETTPRRTLLGEHRASGRAAVGVETRRVELVAVRGTAGGAAGDPVAERGRDGPRDHRAAAAAGRASPRRRRGDRAREGRGLRDHVLAWGS